MNGFLVELNARDVSRTITRSFHPIISTADCISWFRRVHFLLIKVLQYFFGPSRADRRNETAIYFKRHYTLLRDLLSTSLRMAWYNREMFRSTPAYKNGSSVMRVSIFFVSLFSCSVRRCSLVSLDADVSVSTIASSCVRWIHQFRCDITLVHAQKSQWEHFRYRVYCCDGLSLLLFRRELCGVWIHIGTLVYVHFAPFPADVRR